jgi:hypothetical protein
MCFSEKASIITFIVGIMGGILCISLGSMTDKIFGYFLGFVSLMQGIEYLLWKHQKCDDYNKLLSYAGMILNHTQPIILGIVILLVNPKTPNKNLIITTMLLYTSIIIPYSLQYLNNENTQCTLKNDANNHLAWKWNFMKYAGFVYILFLITLSALCILGIPKYGTYGAMVAVISFISSMIFYPSAIGALWCYYTAYLPIAYFGLRKTLVQ